MPRLIMLALLLAACAKPAPKVLSFRNPATPIYSNAVMDMTAITGDWAQVASFAVQGGCDGGAVRISQDPGGLFATGSLCLSGAATTISGPLTIIGPGRLRSAAGPDWWVVWADTALRTLAIGTPDGQFGFVLDRTGGLPPDRMEAARQVFDFNGYTLSALQVF